MADERSANHVKPDGSVGAYNEQQILWTSSEGMGQNMHNILLRGKPFEDLGSIVTSVAGLNRPLVLISQDKRESISMYFLERCGGGPKSKDFWPTIKPFLSQKSTTKTNSNIILKEDDNLISDQSVVCEKMNDFCINIAKNIGIEKAEPVNKEHPSIKKISENIDVESFNFRTVTEKQVSKCIKKLDTKKATGVDAIPPKVVKAAMPSLSQPICNIANAIICKETFPNRLKMAQVTPIFKKR